MSMELEIWLKSSEKDYPKGLQLLKKYCNDPFLWRVFEMGPNSFSRQKLLEEITRINKSTPKEDSIISKVRSIANDQEYKHFTSEVKELVIQARALFKENGDRHGQLRAYMKIALKISDPHELDQFLLKHKTGDLANEILDVDDQIALLFEKIDYFKIHKKLPQQAPLPEIILPEESLEELIRKRNIKRSQISRSKKDPVKCQGLRMELNDLQDKINLMI